MLRYGPPPAGLIEKEKVACRVGSARFIVVQTGNYRKTEIGDVFSMSPPRRDLNVFFSHLKEINTAVRFKSYPYPFFFF